MASHHLTQANALLAGVEGKTPSDVPKDIEELLNKVQEHPNNANTTNNTIYANNELLKAIELLEKISDML